MRQAIKVTAAVAFVPGPPLKRSLPGRSRSAMSAALKAIAFMKRFPCRTKSCRCSPFFPTRLGAAVSVNPASARLAPKARQSSLAMRTEDTAPA